MDDIWHVLNEYDFLLTNLINNDLVCLLCKKILINPRVGPCGCKFCKICIEIYLENSENICPGSTDECKEEKLNLIDNINIDNFLNRKIAKLKLNCPIDSCTFSDQIMNMKQHLIACKENAIKCLLSENGCKYISLSDENVNKHYEMSKDKHLKLVLSKIDNLTNDINLINKSKIELKKEIEILKIENDKLKIENNNDKNLLKQNQEIIIDWNNKYNQIILQNEIQSKQIIDYQLKSENEVNNKNNLMKYLSDYVKCNQTEFFWKINNFSQIKAKCKTVYSDEFHIYEDDIRMQLIFSYCLVDSESKKYNYKLFGRVSHHNKSMNNSCPFICDVTMGIFNRTSGNFILSFNEKKSFDSCGILFENEINDSQIFSKYRKYFLFMKHWDCLTMKCLVRLSV